MRPSRCLAGSHSELLGRSLLTFTSTKCVRDFAFRLVRNRVVADCVFLSTLFVENQTLKAVAENEIERLIGVYMNIAVSLLAASKHTRTHWRTVVVLCILCAKQSVARALSSCFVAIKLYFDDICWQFWRRNRWSGCWSTLVVRLVDIFCCLSQEPAQRCVDLVSIHVACTDFTRCRLLVSFFTLRIIAARYLDS